MGFLSKIFKPVKKVFSSVTGGLGDLIGGFTDIISPVTSLLGGGLGDLVSGGLDYFGGQQTNSANAAEAQKNRDFQAEQTSTAYQRSVADLTKAGLNPMLAYTNGGAGSGGGAQATMQNAIGSALSTARAAKMNNEQINNIREQNQNLRETNNQIKAATLQSISQAELNRAASAKAAAETKNANIEGLLKTNELARSDVLKSGYKTIQSFVNSASDVIKKTDWLGNSRTGEKGPLKLTIRPERK